MGALPDWAIEPIIGIDNAARVLGMSPRALSDLLKSNPFYEQRGRAYAFYPEHIAKLRNARCRSNSTRSKAPTTGMRLEPSPVSAYEKALALATAKERRN